MSRGKLCVEYGRKNIISVNGKKIMDSRFIQNTSSHNVKEHIFMPENSGYWPNDISDSVSEISSQEKVHCFLQNFKESVDYIDPYEFRESSDNHIESYTIYNSNNVDNSCYLQHLEVFGDTSTKYNHEIETENIMIKQKHAKYTNTNDEGNKRTVESTNLKNEKIVQSTIESVHITNYTDACNNTEQILNRNKTLDPQDRKSWNTDYTKKMINILDSRIIPASSHNKEVDNMNDKFITGSTNILSDQGSNHECTSAKSDDSLDTDYQPMSEDSESSDSDTDPDLTCRTEKNECDYNVNCLAIDEYSDIVSKASATRCEKLTMENVKLDDVQIKSQQKSVPKRNESLGVPWTSRDKPAADKDLCQFCFEVVGHFSRHLFRKHFEEEALKKMCAMKNNSKERRMAVIALRRKGNFILKSKQNELKPVRRPVGSVNMETDYFPCTTCLGYFKKSYLWRHKKLCPQLGVVRTKNKSRTNHLSEAQTFIASNALIDNLLEKSRLKTEVFSIMKPDEISLVAKSDPLICLYGESYLNKHKRKQMNVVASNKIREIARLLLALRKFTSIKYCIDFMKPEVYESIVAATKIICGFNAETKKFKASSLALHLGTNLKFLCDVAKKALVTKNPLVRDITDIERDHKVKQVSELRDMISSHWCNDISSLANKALNESKLEKPMLVPLTEDIKCFNNYVLTQATEAYTKLKNNEDIKNNYKCLSECTLCLLLIFNRKRIGEVQFLDINTYEKDSSTLNQEEFQNCLTEFEKNMCLFFKRVVVFRKGSKPVPILFTKKMQEFTELLLEIRRKTDIVSKENKYLFANPGSSDRWMSGSYIVRKFAYECGAKKPQLLTSTKFRKQIATILQLMNFHTDEMEQIARFMGHTEKTHKEFYRLTEDTYQTAKVAKVLLLLNAGKGHEFKGKCLDDIDVRNDVLYFDEDDECKKKPDRSDIRKTIQKSMPLTRSRGCWSAREKELIIKHFQEHLASKTAPKKQNCLDFIRLHEDIFTATDWVRIKTFVYNTYRLK